MGRPQLGFPRLRFAAVKANGIAIVPDHTPTWLFSFALYPVQSLEFPYILTLLSSLGPFHIVLVPSSWFVGNAEVILEPFGASSRSRSRLGGDQGRSPRSRLGARVVEKTFPG